MMKIRYLGTAAAEGFPAVFCNCAACKAARKDIGRELRTRSQMLVNEDLLIDFPPESYYHAMRFGVDLSAVRTLLVTHSHTDHFYAQEFVNRGYKFAEGMASEFWISTETVKCFPSMRRARGAKCVMPSANISVCIASVRSIPFGRAAMKFSFSPRTIPRKRRRFCTRYARGKRLFYISTIRER